MKTEQLPALPTGEAPDFYYRHLKLPYATGNAPETDESCESDPTITDVIDVATDDGVQLGFVFKRTDHTVELVDAVTGEHVRIRFGERDTRERKRKPSQA